MHDELRQFLQYLRRHPEIRRGLRAAPGKTLLYAGSFFKAMWREIEDFKRTHPEYSDKETLPEVLARIQTPGTGYKTLLDYVKHIDANPDVSPADKFRMWRALSGIFAANAEGRVSFQIGTGVSPRNKVFAATEVPVLARNRQVDETTSDLVAYFQRCIASGQSDIGTGFMSA